MAKLKISYSGASDAIGIKGYETQYKISTDIDWIDLPTYYTTETFGVNFIYDIVYGKTYNVRTRTINTNNLVSSYKTTDYVFTSTHTAKRVSVGVEEFGNYCLNTPTVDFYMTKPLASLTLGDYIYNDSGLLVPFNGNNLLYRISNDAVIGVDYFGRIMYYDPIGCYVPPTTTQYKRSYTTMLNNNHTYAGAACDSLTITDTPLPAPKIYIYKTPENIVLGDKVYTNSDGSTPLNGNFQWYTICNMEETVFYEIRVSTVGAIMGINNCAEV